MLGRRFPAPIRPPAPPDNPGVHVAVVSPRESTVFGRRVRTGGGRRGLGDRGTVVEGAGGTGRTRAVPLE